MLAPPTAILAAGLAGEPLLAPWTQPSWGAPAPPLGSRYLSPAGTGGIFYFEAIAGAPARHNHGGVASKPLAAAARAQGRARGAGSRANRIRINTLVVAARLPSMYPNRAAVEAGGLVSYRPNFPDLYHRAGDYVDKILRGANPAEIPVEQPTKFDLVINLTTAKALGLTVPPSLLARADEV